MALSPGLFLVTREEREKEESFHGNAGAEHKWNRRASSQGRAGGWKVEVRGKGRAAPVKSVYAE